MPIMTSVVVPGLLGLLLVLELLPALRPKFQTEDSEKHVAICWVCILIIVALLVILLVL